MRCWRCCPPSSRGSPSASRARPGGPLKLLLFAGLLVLWGNLSHPLIGATAALPGGSWQFVAAGAIVVVVSVLAARSLGLDAAALGLARAGALGGAAIGALAGGAIAAIDVALLRLAPSIIGVPIVYGPLYDISAEELVRHVAVFLPLGAVIPEEVAFRGALLGALLRRWDARDAIAGSALTFALWHGTVAIATVLQTTLGQAPGPWVIAFVVGTLGILFVGGAIMAVLRVFTGALSTAIAAHWAFNAVILIGLWAAQRPAGPTG